jgi:hypothetical protein
MSAVVELRTAPLQLQPQGQQTKRLKTGAYAATGILAYQKVEWRWNRISRVSDSYERYSSTLYGTYISAMVVRGYVKW